MWMSKPVSNIGGKGIKIYQSHEELKQEIMNQKSHVNSKMGELIVQKYIDNPLLIKGRKFDFRSYIIIVKISLINLKILKYKKKKGEFFTLYSLLFTRLYQISL